MGIYLKFIMLFFILITAVFFIGCGEKDNKNNTPIFKKELVIWYKFDEKNGTKRVIDGSGNGNDGTLYGGVAFVDGLIGKAGSFDGVDDYILVPNSSTFPTNAITISYWINRENVSSYLDYYISKENAFESYLKDDGNFESALWKEKDKLWSHYLAENSMDNTLNKWILYTMTFSNDSKEAKSFINGVLVNRKIEKDKNSYLRASSKPMYIGRNSQDGEIFINSKLDDLRIYNGALSESEIKTLYKQGEKHHQIKRKAFLFMKNYTFAPNYKSSFKDEVKRVEDYLSELNITLETQFGYKNINLEEMKAFDIILFYDFGWADGVSKEVINSMTALHHSKIPLYFLGDDLAFKSRDNEKNLNWENLIGLELGGNNSYEKRIDVDLTHPISKGVSTVYYKADLDNAKAKDFATTILKHGSYASLVSYKDEYGKVVSQLPNLNDGEYRADANSSDLNNLKKIFQNSIKWLLE